MEYEKSFEIGLEPAAWFPWQQ